METKKGEIGTGETWMRLTIPPSDPGKQRQVHPSTKARIAPSPPRLHTPARSLSLVLSPSIPLLARCTRH